MEDKPHVNTFQMGLGLILMAIWLAMLIRGLLEKEPNILELGFRTLMLMSSLIVVLSSITPNERRRSQ